MKFVLRILEKSRWTITNKNTDIQRINIKYYINKKIKRNEDKPYKLYIAS